MAINIFKIHDRFKRETVHQGLMFISHSRSTPHILVFRHANGPFLYLQSLGMTGEDLFFVGLKNQLVESMKRAGNSAAASSMCRVIGSMQILFRPLTVNRGEMVRTEKHLTSTADKGT